MNTLGHIEQLLKASPKKSLDVHTYFYKTGPGDYAEHDQFLGITNPTLRQIAKQHASATRADLGTLLASPYNEKRLLALFIMNHQYQTGNAKQQQDMYDFYLMHMDAINNWNLVDLSAYQMVGKHLLKRNKNTLTTMAQSHNMWERRIAIVATYAFIKEGQLTWTFKLAKQLLNDPHDLMHKAAGWMLREAGKKDQDKLEKFLDQYTRRMPRTMLRYAIERLPEKMRRGYLAR